MAGNSKARLKEVAQLSDVRTEVRLTGDLFHIGALLAGVQSILKEIMETGTGPSGNLNLDSLNAMKLVDDAVSRIEPLAEAIGCALKHPAPKQEASHG